jgi:hypothetical protein
MSYRPVNPSVHQSINPSIHQSINPSIHQSIKVSIWRADSSHFTLRHLVDDAISGDPFKLRPHIPQIPIISPIQLLFLRAKMP